MDSGGYSSSAVPFWRFSMAKIEKFDSPLKCLNCKIKGISTWEENENPVYSGGLNTKLISVSNGFSFSGSGIFCNQCKEPVLNL
jgi:hypothetical protein